MDGWVDATFYHHEGVRYAVVYRHLTRFDRDREGNRTFFSFRLHPRTEYDNPLAWEWITEFARTVKNARRVILATHGDNTGYLYEIGISDNGHNQLMMELLPVLPAPRVEMLVRPEPKAREFYPKAFAVEDDAWALSVLDRIGPSDEEWNEIRRRDAIDRRRNSHRM